MPKKSEKEVLILDRRPSRSMIQLPDPCYRVLHVHISPLNVIESNFQCRTMGGHSAYVLGVAFLLLQTVQGRLHHEHAGSKGLLQCNAESARLSEQALLQDPQNLKSFIKKMPEVYLQGSWLQIGANTLDPLGHTYQVEDPLLEYLPLYAEYRKIFVEAIPFLFEQLKNNTQHMPNALPINAAIVPNNEAGKTVKMYCPPKEDFNEWLVGICSMDPEVVKHAVGDKPPRVYDVRALSVEALLKEYDVKNVRVAMIDTEGFDVKILKMLPFDSPGFKPDLVVFEHTEITPDEHKEGMDFLHSHCYSLAFDRENTYGLKLLPS